MSPTRAPVRFAFSPARFRALLDVHRGGVRFGNGLGAPAGYRRDAGAGAPPDERALSELWRADLIDLVTADLFAAGGQRVVLTAAGRDLLYEWEAQALGAA
ncbi:hypothetical protein [Saccharopolyspora taberi]|uniref:Uncharacterized protein n=1 Tax=Saccharopolyspora taberi TaxID=60895 RepID=A0ABN3VIH8_9PSEU